ncbi:MAG: SWIM zinc finger family protein [Armatimonadetes bacterium]|nr:SWIM zinc finger family protein [Armatimonadota bacterium]
MEVTQNYARPSAAGIDDAGALRMGLTAEASRPGVQLTAQILDSRSYARVMLALYNVVSSDLRSKQKDYSGYQKWVEERYLEELDTTMGAKMRALPGLKEKQGRLKERLKHLSGEIRPLEGRIQSAEFYGKRGEYFNWLRKHDMDAWWVLDPVVSVHEDCVVFEVFSLDESSYGRVTVPWEKLDVLGDVRYGTTNVDYSSALADEMRRIRSYRPAFLSVAAEGVSIATGAGERVEKKIDLPPTWVRGFLQVQSAAVYPAIEVPFSPETIADVLAALQREREKTGPRSLRFQLMPGECPTITIEPWGTVIKERIHKFTGDTATEIRLWGRRRLLAFADLLPHADLVTARFLGTGMPSYWSITLDGHRFDIGVSGWTKNDWSSAARFDVLAATGQASDGDIAKASQELEKRLKLVPADIADLSTETATAALQRLCATGMAMYDLADSCYRWRQLLPFPVPESEGDQRSKLAARIVQTGGVSFLKDTDDDEAFSTLTARTDDTTFRFRAWVRGGETRREAKFAVTLDLDNDGRVRFASCTCSFFKREKLRKGPCAHILAAVGLASQQLLGAKAAKKADTSSADAFDFTDKTFVFTGALTKFTREQAEGIVVQRGGKASGSVSKNTHYLVAGDKAGSKLVKAQELKIPVMTEDEFLALLGGSIA